MKKVFLFAAMAMLALVGCEKQNQSSLDFEDAKNEAKVSGTLVYFADKAGAATEEVALANQRIYFQVEATEYADGAIGVKTFEAKTDANGAFEITVPMGSKAVSGKLLTDVIVLGEAPNRIFLKETDLAITLNAGDNKVKKRIAEIDQVLTACQGNAILKGKVTYNAGLVKKGDATEDGVVAAPEGLKVSIKVAYDDADKVLIALTKADGSYEYNVPVPAGQTLAADIDIDQFEGKFTEMFNNKPLALDAIFGLAAIENANLTDGKTEVKDLEAVAIVKAEATSKTTKIPVALEINKTVEEFVYSDVEDYENIIVNVKRGEEPMANQAAKLEFRHMDGTEVIGKLIYDVVTDKDGLVKQADYLVYDSWKFDDINIVVVIDKFAVNNYEQNYCVMGEMKKGKWEASEFEWVGAWGKGKGSKATNYDESQLLAATYELESGAQKFDGFFPVKIVAKAKVTLPQSSVDELLGTDDSADKNKEDGNLKYSRGLDYTAGVAY